MHKKRKILVIGRLRPFNEEAWKRLIMAYAYYLHEEQQTASNGDDATEPPVTNDGGAV